MDIIEDTKAEWRDLGFFYDRDEEKKEWLFKGDREGLMKLAELFRRYGKNEKNRSLFEHDHYGPYMYFKVITVFAEKGFNEDAIYGNLEDIFQLGEIIEKRITKMQVGDIAALRSEYSPESTYEMKVILEADGFDPVSVDGWIKMKESEQDASDNADKPRV